MNNIEIKLVPEEEIDIKTSQLRKLPKGPFIFSNQLIKKMENTIDDSIKRNIELGFTLCKKPKSQELTNGKICKGKLCEVLVLEIDECKKGETPVGIYHSHGNDRALPSMHDIWHAYNSNTFCIGGTNKGNKEIKCFERKKEYNSDINSRMVEEVSIENDFIKRIKALKERTNKITEDTFKIVSLI